MPTKPIQLQKHLSDVDYPEAVRARATDADRVDPDAADRLLAASCAGHDAGLVPLRPRLHRRHYWTDDMHWSAAGHRVAAAAVAEVAARSAVGRRDVRRRATAAALATLTEFGSDE